MAKICDLHGELQDILMDYLVDKFNMHHHHQYIAKHEGSSVAISCVEIARSAIIGEAYVKDGMVCIIDFVNCVEDMVMNTSRFSLYDSSSLDRVLMYLDVIAAIDKRRH